MVSGAPREEEKGTMLTQEHETPSNSNKRNTDAVLDSRPNMKMTQITIDIPEEHLKVMQTFATLTDQKLEEYAAEALVEWMALDVDRFFGAVAEDYQFCTATILYKKLGKEDCI